jgi:hypothetical protein
MSQEVLKLFFDPDSESKAGLNVKSVSFWWIDELDVDLTIWENRLGPTLPIHFT